LTPAKESVADRGYDSDAVLNFIQQAGARAHIPSLSRRLVRRSVDPATYRQRNLVERVFNKLKHFRRIALRQARPKLSRRRPARFDKAMASCL
jgi:transposase